MSENIAVKFFVKYFWQINIELKSIQGVYYPMKKKTLISYIAIIA